ncbi:IMS domain-containing protein [Stenomitos frigidus]|uniref:Molecular chaperone DnaJ n=1 Tax=Stenomitos frigidus ULC18 TaxID=2107698 RepID=A0A2T1DX44_9CYAN|nr:IMS domain-containing protein [Stenomitos frigidus]PSB25067.1 molecular chaperone DnaJ [Stenomitos frigidus ULC18]
MRIPLDYYRILGLPIQATAEQLRQAHRDRTLQLPRREYSDAAIASRKKLFDEAFAVLSDVEQRQLYDTRFLARAYELEPENGAAIDKPHGQSPEADAGSDSHTPSIEIQDDQFVGALLVLQDLGEYELVLRLGRPFLTGGSASLKQVQFGDPSIVFSDIVLTVALACMELGREQWQQRQYENASEALETGQQLLLREGLFAEVRGEIQSDLYKLRPYRVLELLALPEDQPTLRYQGMHLLQDMLQERDGIDGAGDDQSGLNIDDFLRFIQQLRGYLTAAEQQVLFEQEAQRPSPVATYLAVYALLARGFAERQPALVRRAKLMLTRLSGRQDVHLEQAVCALLLGQTEKASQALERSQDYGPIAFIREHSQGAPDLLPGLCLYGERWLQDEVFPHFRDLMQKQASLKDYFADQQVQSYLEELPEDADADAAWSLPLHASVANAGLDNTIGDSANRSRGDRGMTEPLTVGMNGRSRRDGIQAVGNVAEGNRVATERSLEQEMSHEYLINTARAHIAARTGAATISPEHSAEGTLPVAERVPQSSRTPTATATRPAADRVRPANRSHGNGDGRGNPAAYRRGERPAKTKLAALLPWLLPLGLIAAIVTLGFMAGSLWRRASTPTVQEEQLNLRLDRPLIDQPSPTNTATPGSSPTASTGLITATIAEKVIQTWLSAKADAMGADHNVAPLAKILEEPKLAEWEGAAADAKRSNQYRKYEHSVKVSSVEPNQTNPDQASVLADVTEATEYYEAGQRKGAESSPNLRIDYQLVRKDGVWLIQNWKLLK